MKKNEKNKLLEQQKKLLKQQNEQKKIIEQQNDEQNKLLEQQKKLIEKQNDKQNKLLEQQKQEEDIINELSRNANKMTKPISFRTFAPRKDPFDDINKNKEKLTPSPSKICAPITKSHEPQGVAAGEQAGIAIMENKLRNSKNYIEYLKKELRNTDFLSKKALEISNKIIKEEYEVRELEKEIREREEDIERRYRKYYPDKYYPYKK